MTSRFGCFLGRPGNGARVGILSVYYECRHKNNVLTKWPLVEHMPLLALSKLREIAVRAERNGFRLKSLVSERRLLTMHFILAGLTKWSRSWPIAVR